MTLLIYYSVMHCTQDYINLDLIPIVTRDVIGQSLNHNHGKALDRESATAQ